MTHTPTVSPTSTPLSQPSNTPTGDPRRGLAGYWPLDEWRGTETYDASGNGNTGNLVNGPIWSAGVYGAGLIFDGVDDYVDLGTSGFNLASELTIAFWVNPADTRPDLQIMIARSPYVYPFRIAMNGTQVVTTLRTASGTNYLFSNSVLQANTWYHVALTYGAGWRTIYVNGEPDASSALAGDLYPIGTAERTTLSCPIAGECFNGKIDDVRIYNRCLEPVEIRQIMNAASTTTTLTMTYAPSVTATNTPSPTNASTPEPASTSTPDPTGSATPTLTVSVTFIPTLTSTPTHQPTETAGVTPSTQLQ